MNEQCKNCKYMEQSRCKMFFIEIDSVCCIDDGFWITPSCRKNLNQAEHAAFAIERVLKYGVHHTTNNFSSIEYIQLIIDEVQNRLNNYKSI